MKAAGLLPTRQALGKEIVLGLIAAVAVAFIIGHIPALKAWIKKERED